MTPNILSLKDELRLRYENASPATNLELQKRRLTLLESSLTLRRAIPSLRQWGSKGLPPQQARGILQNGETIATLQAIKNKIISIKTLNSELTSLRRRNPSHHALIKDQKLLHIHYKKWRKKIDFLRSTDSYKFPEWKPKHFVTRNLDQYSDRVLQKKRRNRLKNARRKLRQKEQEVIARAKMAVERKLVVNFTDTDVPLYSVAVLACGPGFVPHPRLNKLVSQIDASNAGNKLAWKTVFRDTQDSPNRDVPPQLLKKTLTAPCNTVSDPTIRVIKEKISQFATALNPRRIRNNLNVFERKGLEWLISATKEGRIAITQADKGGAILVVPCDVITTITASKLGDTSMYEDIGTIDPSPRLRSRLLEMWHSGFKAGFVNEYQTSRTVGIICKRTSPEYTISTGDSTKPGTPYGYPLFKIHKLSDTQISQKVIPPARFVTDLSMGVTVRSDKFCVWKWLGPLSRDYCPDLIKDTTQALQTLESWQEDNFSHRDDPDWHNLSIDVVSLYDSLHHNIILDALKDAFSECRPDWTQCFRSWLIDLIIHTCNSTVLKSGNGHWYRLHRGIATGGVLSVDLGNITLAYVFKTLIYDSGERPAFLAGMMRFVDDITGMACAPRATIESYDSMTLHPETG